METAGYPHFQVLKSLGDKDEVRTMTEIDKQSFSTLEAANEVAGKLAEAWIDRQRIQKGTNLAL